MSFSSKTKEDLVRIRLKSPSARLAQLSGITLTCGALYVGRGGTGAVFSSETLSVVKQVAEFATQAYDLETAMELTQQERRQRPLYVLTLTGADAERFLLDTGMLCTTPDGITLSDGIPQELMAEEEDARCFLRGVFLGSGSCLNPARGYHLEMIARSEGVADGMIRTVARFDLTAKLHRRKEKFVVYCKGEDVSGYLALIGASNAALTFENVRAEKDFRNYVNRKSNCETANIGKTVDAGLSQIHAIEVIEQTMDLNRLPVPLYEAAMLRLGHPDATLQELADMAEIGKSGMNHRLSRLIHMAEEMENG